jgi:hypothetical protein
MIHAISVDAQMLGLPQGACLQFDLGSVLPGRRWAQWQFLQPPLLLLLLMPGFLGLCLKVHTFVEEVVVEYWWQAPQLVMLLAL